MILQILNSGGGLLLNASFVKEKVQNQGFSDVLNSLLRYEAEIGVGIAVVGLIGLLERLGIFYINLPLGASFPQSLPAIAIGLVLGAPIILRYAPFLRSTIDTLVPYRAWIGTIALLSGLGSLLFGCVLPLVCHVPF